MITGYVIRKNEYHDSVFLMRIARQISEQKGVLQAAALMGTEKNKSLLSEIGIGGAGVDAASPGDLIVAVKAEDAETLAAVLGKVEPWLSLFPGRPGTLSIRTLEEAIERQPQSNLAVISVPGEYAFREARRALERGLNVFLFSDHVSVEREKSLKEYARDRGLIVMGPDCGTSIIKGTGIGFANAVRRGPIGVIGASGTGIQEFTCLVHHGGSGISHAIGTGSRDLSDEIRGISVLSGLSCLESDPQTKIIAILAKPPGQRALAQLVPGIQACSKPVIACFLGTRKNIQQENPHYQIVRTLDEAAARAVQMVTGQNQLATEPFARQSLLRKERSAMGAGQKYIRGIFAGGTFCYQAQQILQDAGVFAYSNAPLEGNRKLPDLHRSLENTLIDMGADEFTSARPHPMIDSALRRERILTETRDPEVAILLLDFILGFISSPDSAGELIEALAGAKVRAREQGRSLSVVASVCGTAQDPQDLGRQVRTLQKIGAVVFFSSARAAEFCALLLQSLGEKSHGQ